MATTQQLIPGAGTPSTSGGRTASLPPDLLHQAVHRLGLLCGGLAIMALLGIGWRHTVALRGQAIDPSYLLGSDIVAVVLAIGGVALFLLSRSDTTDRERLLALGLVYEVVSCLGVGMSERLMFDYGAPPQRPSFTLFIFLTFPFLVPTAPRRRALTSFMCFAMLPTATVVSTLFGKPLTELSVFRTAMGPMAVAAVLGVLGASVVYRLAAAVGKARRLGAYELVQCLGVGGMGEVWLAHHRLLARPAAIKLIRAEALGPDVIARFEREAQATAKLRSPHTIELYDFGSADDGTFYFVMELLDGYDLEVLVNRFGPLPANRVVHILDQVCRSLREAHAQGLVHRDIKPANIFLCRLGDEPDFVKVLDFGLVKLPDHDLLEDENLSGGTSLMGTPAYMPPEVARGETVDARADLYALACVAYWLLTGHRVFTGANMVETMLKHATEPPAPPSSLTDHPIPPALESLIIRCLDKDPAHRPQDATALHAALAPLAADHPWPDDDARTWWSSHQPSPATPPPTPEPGIGFATTVVRSEDHTTVRD